MILKWLTFESLFLVARRPIRLEASSVDKHQRDRPYRAIGVAADAADVAWPARGVRRDGAVLPGLLAAGLTAS